MSEVLTQLRQEHQNLGRLMKALEEQITVIAEGGSPDLDLMLSILDYTMNYPDLCHHPKEDLVFERLRQRDAAAAETVGDILSGHAQLNEKTQNFAAALNNLVHDAELPREWFVDLVRDYIEANRRHIEMEEQVFVPLAEKTLLPEDWAEIDTAIASPDDPLFGEAVHQQYEALYRRIVSLGS